MFHIENVSGGVFIATLFGLALALLTLLGEVLYYRKKRKSINLKNQNIKQEIQKPLNKFSLRTKPFVESHNHSAVTGIILNSQKPNKLILGKNELLKNNQFNLHHRNINKIHFTN